jgi:ketosteroid isomerase-like protein
VPTESLSELFTRWLRAWAARDIAALIDIYADNCTVETPTMGILNGRQALEEAERKLFSNFQDISFEDTELIIAGNRLVVTATVTGTDLNGTLTRQGTPIRFPAILLWTTENGRIVRERRLWDFSGFVLQRVERELNDAAEVQRLLLPPGGFTGDGFEVAASSIPARTIGGDFFDYFELPDGGFAFALGDISGKGPSAALLASSVLAILAAGGHTAHPGVALEAANRAMLRRAVPGKFATVVFATLSKDGRLTYSNAGHNPPLLLGRTGAQWLRTGGMFAGVFEHAQFEEETVQLQAGDRLVVYSDGITEARNTENAEFGEDRLLTSVEAHREQAPAALVRSILETVREFSSGTGQGDDLTVLVLSCTRGLT